jgi:hypothetical protein
MLVANGKRCYVYTVRGVSGRADMYGFDVFAGVPLSLDVLDVPPSVAAAIPAIFSSEETGGRRGTVYLGQGDRGTSAIREMVDRGFLSWAKRKPSSPLLRLDEPVPDARCLE